MSAKRQRKCKAARSVTTFDARTEKNIATLHAKAQPIARRFMAKAIPAMAAHGVDVRIISGTRTYKEQDALYAKGRTAPGQRVTNARGGYSNHNFGVAFDVGLFRGVKYLGTPQKFPKRRLSAVTRSQIASTNSLYRILGPIGRSVGLEWGGDWTSIVDMPHFQVRTGLSLAQMRARVSRGESVL